MQLASSLLQYWTAQRNAASSQGKKLRTSIKHRNRQSQLYSCDISQALLWGTGCLSSELPDAFEELLNMSRLLADIERSKSNAKQLARNKQTSLATAQWLNKHLPLDSCDPFVSLTATGWIYALSYATASLSSTLWLETLTNVLTQVDRAWNDCSSESLLPTMVWGCEIPLALATQIEQIDGQTKLVSETRQRLKFLISRVENAESMWMRGGGRELRSLLAGMFRCTWLLEQLGGKPLSKKDWKYLMRFARTALSLSEIGGQPLLQDEVMTDDNSLWKALLKHWPSNQKLNALTEAIAIKGTCNTIDKDVETDLPSLGQLFEGAQAAVMRLNWKNNASIVAVDYSGDPMRLQLYGPHRRKLIDGAWDLKVEQDGIDLVIDSPWEQICWLEDDEMDYLELQCEAEGVCKIQRQVMLLRNEATVFLCDSLLSQRSSHWQMTSSMKLAESTQVESFPENTEVRLVACRSKKETTIARPVGIVLPIGFSEWKTATNSGELFSEDGLLCLRQVNHGTRLTCPLVVGLGPKAAKLPYTWRHLTIADDMKIQPPEEARGYRVQIGSDQMLFYRSLGALRRRTMMSMHIYSEFYAARFDSRDGEIEPLVEVSTEE